MKKKYFLCTHVKQQQQTVRFFPFSLSHGLPSSSSFVFFSVKTSLVICSSSLANVKSLAGINTNGTRRSLINQRKQSRKRFSHIPHERNRDEMRYLLPSKRKMNNVRRITHLLISFSCTIFECLFNGEENERYPHIHIFLFSLTPFEVCVDEKIILPCSSIAFLPIEQCAR